MWKMALRLVVYSDNAGRVLETRWGKRSLKKDLPSTSTKRAIRSGKICLEVLIHLREMFSAHNSLSLS